MWIRNGARVIWWIVSGKFIYEVWKKKSFNPRKSFCNTRKILKNRILSPNKSLNILNVCHILIIWHWLVFIYSLSSPPPDPSHTIALWFRSPTPHSLTHTHIVNSLYWDVSACINIDKLYWGSGAGLNNKRGKVAGRSSQTVCTKSNYQSRGINIPAVWQVTAPSFQLPPPPSHTHTASMG